MSVFLKAQPLTPQSYMPFGSVIAAGHVTSKTANMGTAERFDFLAELENLRPHAKGNLSVFRCKPYLDNPISIRLLERHAYSVQAFVPMGGPERYLVVVSKGGDAPDETTLAAFVADGRQGVSYRPGVWHHPIIALARETDFACLVWEDGTGNDTEVASLAAPVSVAYA